MDGFACKARIQSVSMENDRVNKGGSIGLLTSYEGLPEACNRMTILDLGLKDDTARMASGRCS